MFETLTIIALAICLIPLFMRGLKCIGITLAIIAIIVSDAWAKRAKVER